MFVPALLVGVLMVLRPIKMGGFTLLIKIGLVSQVLISIIWGVLLEFDRKPYFTWSFSLLSVSLLGIC